MLDGSSMLGYRDWLTHERMSSRGDAREDEALWTASSRQGVVTSAHYSASVAGATLLESGGNAVDAAIATSLALGVVEPSSSGLGGMGMMMIHLPDEGRTLCLDGACRAPRRATPEEVSRGERKLGLRAAAVPMLPALLGHALRRFGTKSPAEVLAPAIELAESGYPITEIQCDYLGRFEEDLASRAPSFLTPEGHAPAPGAIFRQPRLAETLRRLATHGFEELYEGEVGRLILEEMNDRGGFISEADFVPTPAIEELEPLRGRFGSWKVATMPPPGGGSTLLQLLHLHDALDRDIDPNSDEASLFFGQLIRQARSDRNRHPLGVIDHGDGRTSSLWDPVPISKAASALEHRLDEGGETSHFCVMERGGGVVSMTQSIERTYGCKAACEKTGILFNGYLKTFKVENRSHPYFLKPGRRARSNAAPTILFEKDDPFLAIGSTGSERMLSSIYQVLTRLRWGEAPFHAVCAPRLHCTPSGCVHLEEERFSPTALRMLERAGLTLEAWSSPWAFEAGGLHLALRRDGLLQGVAEPRRDGGVAAL